MNLEPSTLNVFLPEEHNLAHSWNTKVLFKIRISVRGTLKYHRRWRQHRAITVETVDTVENVEWVMDGWVMGDTPQTVMTTRAPAVLKNQDQLSSSGKERNGQDLIIKSV